MQNYNNFNSYGVPGAVPTPMPRMNQWQNNWPGYAQVPQQSADGRVYVNGRAGADAYPIPQNMNVITLWDTESKRFYVKGYDNNGMPRVLEDNDYSAHVEPEKVQQSSIDTSTFATKDDIKAAISEAFSNLQIPSMAGYVTRQEFDQGLSELTLGNGGRIVRNNDANG